MTIKRKKVKIGGVPCFVASWVTPSMLKQMRESPTTSHKLASAQVKAGYLRRSPGEPEIEGEGF